MYFDYATLSFVAFEILSILTFFKINKKVNNSPDLEKWKKNYEQGGCGVLDMTYALQNASLNGCGYLSLHWAAYVFLLYRDKFSSA